MSRTRAIGVATHLLGVAAFAYPFVLHPHAGAESLAHATDAPVLFSILGALVVALAVSDLRSGAMDVKHLALLGVLAGLNAMVRLPGSLAGASLMFALPILCGYAFGARFGFLLGATSMAASAFITGGLGPWLPFEMFGLGWVGAGGGLVRRLAGERAGLAIAALAAYGWASGLAYGALVNLWFWPYLAGASAISWTPGASVAETARHYWRFYLLTSLAWDSARAFANAALIAALGAPVLRLLVRFRTRLDVRWTPVPSGPAASSMEP